MELNAFLMSKVNQAISKKHALLANVKEAIGDAEKFAVEYSSEIIDATVVTNKVDQIQNDVQPISWSVMTGEDQGVVEDVTYVFSATTNMDN